MLCIEKKSGENYSYHLMKEVSHVALFTCTQDSRKTGSGFTGAPTVEVEVTVGEGIIGIEGYTARAIVPSGASTGRFEAVELRDGEKGCYLGLGVQKAVENVNTRLAEVIVGENALDQVRIDELLIRADGTENKASTGANAVLGVSMAIARAAAMALRIPLYQYLGGCHTKKLPVPMMNIMNGGKHADNTVDLQEFMIMPCGAGSFEDGIRMCVEIYQFLKILLQRKGTFYSSRR